MKIFKVIFSVTCFLLIMGQQVKAQQHSQFEMAVGKSDIPAPTYSPTYHSYRMSIEGKAIFEEVVIQPSNNWPDYVFQPNYQLMPLADLKKYISLNKHLPNIPSAEEIATAGKYSVGMNNIVLLEKVEELTLYTLQLDAENDSLAKQLASMKARMECIKSLLNQ